MRHTQKRAPALGVRRPDGTLAVVVRFDEDTFGSIRARAVSERTSFGEQVRQLVEWGLMADG